MNTLIATTLSLVLSSTDISSSEWQIQNKRAVSVDGRSATLIRYSKAHNNHLHGEHFSTVITDDGTLLGFVRLAIPHDNIIISREEAQTASDKFLQTFAPDLLTNRKILWIEPHEETLEINGKAIAIRGMKVKSRNTKTGLYFWTIVDSNKQVFVFERDIQWLNLKSKRGTEKWLHDAWLEKQL